MQLFCSTFGIFLIGSLVAGVTAGVMCISQFPCRFGCFCGGRWFVFFCRFDYQRSWLGFAGFRRQ